MKPKSGQRYRICGTPSRLGCVTCKIRRVKCDEAKPFCKRCTGTGRRCDGYIPIEQLTSNRNPRATALVTPKDPLEQRYLQFFISVTIHESCKEGFLKGFWTRRVVLASNYEPCIRHAIIAIGALHQSFLSKQESSFKAADPSIKSFAFHQYIMAITHLQTMMSAQTQRMDIPLLCCILFTCFDSLSGNHDSAIIHLKAGLQILQDIRNQCNTAISSTQRTQNLAWEKDFAPLLLALGVQVATFANPKSQEDRASLWNMMKLAKLPLNSPRFYSIDEARHALDTVVTDIMADRTASQGSYEHSHQHVMATTLWKAMFDHYLEGKQSDASAQNEDAHLGEELLMIHWQMICIVIGTPEESEKLFQQLLPLCEAIMRCDKESRFSTGIGIIAPLFFVSLRAPRMNLRRQALNLLAQTARREGPWESSDAAMVAAAALFRTEGHSNASNTSASPFASPYGTPDSILWEDIYFDCELDNS